MTDAPLVLDPDRNCSVIVDQLHVKYRVYSSGKAVNNAKSGLLQKTRRGIGGVHAIRGVSFVASRNESIGVIGSNGSGKSTLMRAITGLTPPESGAVYASARPNMLGVGAALIPNLSGERNIVLGGLAMGFSPREMAEMRNGIVSFRRVGGVHRPTDEDLLVRDAGTPQVRHRGRSATKRS